MKICSFGSLNLDHVYTVKHFVQAKQTVPALGYEIHIGGKGLNQSVALSRAGADVYHAGKIGSDGQRLVEFLKENVVDTSLIRTSSKPTGHAVIQVCQGENCILVCGGANHDIEETMIEDVLDRFSKGDLLLVQNEINNLECMIKKAKEKGMTVVLNPSPVSDAVTGDVLEHTDILILNEVEAAALSGSSQTDGKALLQAMIDTFPQKHIVLTLGEQGAWAYDTVQKVYQPAFSVPVKDTTGAGDTFTGFYIEARSRGESLQRCLQIASKAASLSIQKEGAARSIPTWNETIGSL